MEVCQNAICILGAHWNGTQIETIATRKIRGYSCIPLWAQHTSPALLSPPRHAPWWRVVWPEKLAELWKARVFSCLTKGSIFHCVENLSSPIFTCYVLPPASSFSFLSVINNAIIIITIINIMNCARLLSFGGGGPDSDSLAALPLRLSTKFHRSLLQIAKINTRATYFLYMYTATTTMMTTTCYVLPPVKGDIKDRERITSAAGKDTQSTWWRIPRPTHRTKTTDETERNKSKRT